MAHGNKPTDTGSHGLDTLEVMSLITSDIPLEGWREVANCKGMPVEMFYNDYGNVSKPVKDACEGCSVVNECLVDALKVPREADFGYRAGMSRLQRRHLRIELKGRFNYKTTRIYWDDELQAYVSNG